VNEFLDIGPYGGRKGRRGWVKTSGGGDAEEEVVLVQLTGRDLIEKPFSREERAAVEDPHWGLLTQLQQWCE
jgi:hypothetical protein